MKSEELRAQLAQAQADLTDAGFVLVSARSFEHFGDTLIELERGAIRVKIGLDRGELFVTMEAPGGAGGYEMPIWEACLEDRSPSLVPGVFASDVDILLRRLPDFEDLVAIHGSKLDECLQRAGASRFWMRQQKGLTRRPWERAPD